jgi:hypothetical protein
MIKKEINYSNNKRIDYPYKKDIFFDLQDYMFTSNNINRFTKHIIIFNNENLIPKSSLKYIKNNETINKKIYPLKNVKEFKPIENIKEVKPIENVKKYDKKKETMYRPKQKDSLFWCFYILKYGFSNYEMEINNQYFVVEKKEKFKYIELLRKNKDLLKLHKIKPLTQLEDDLANKDKISPKTFFALCILENINVLLVDKRKVYELLINDSPIINIVHRNNETFYHSIELDVTEDICNKYRETYYKLNNFDTSLKGIGSYKLQELIDLCEKLNINIEEHKNKTSKQKITKKDIYELLVMNY